MRIVILSRNPKLYSTKRLQEAAEKRGHEVMVVDHYEHTGNYTNNSCAMHVEGTSCYWQPNSF